MSLTEHVTLDTQPTCDHEIGAPYYTRLCGAPASVFEDIDGARRYRCVTHIKTLPLRDKAQIGAVLVERP